MTTRAVMSLVIEAIGMAIAARREYSTEEFEVSSTSAALERSTGSLSAGRCEYFRWVFCSEPCGMAAWVATAASDRHTMPVTVNQRTLFIAPAPRPQVELSVSDHRLHDAYVMRS